MARVLTNSKEYEIIPIKRVGMLTVKEVANDLQIDDETVARLLRAGKLKGIKVGSVWRIDERELENFKEGKHGNKKSRA